MGPVGDSVRVDRGRLSAVHEEVVASRMEPDSTPIVPAQRLLEIAGVLSDGAARMHEALRTLEPAQRDALLGMMTGQIGMMIELWTDLVRGVVSVPVQAGSGARAPGEMRRDHLTSIPEPGRAAPAPWPGPPEHATHVAAGPQPEAYQPEASPSEAPEAQAQRAPQPMQPVQPVTRDELTGVLNRPAGMAALGREIERCRQVGARFVLGYLNVDDMHQVNETHGPRAGDELLRKVTAALRATLRSYDVILRLGGDDFLFSLAGADAATAEQRLREFTAILGGEAPGASASVGFAELYPDDTVDDLIARAQHALAASRQPRRPLR